MHIQKHKILYILNEKRKNKVPKMLPIDVLKLKNRIAMKMTQLKTQAKAQTNSRRTNQQQIRALTKMKLTHEYPKSLHTHKIKLCKQEQNRN